MNNARGKVKKGDLPWAEFKGLQFSAWKFQATKKKYIYKIINKINK